MLTVTVRDDSLEVGKHLTVSFHRTVRVPETNRDFPLPPTFGRFALARMGEGPPETEALVAIPIRNREALWIGFEGPRWRPNAVKVGVGDVNAIDGGAWNNPLSSNPQNYIVTGSQFWLDGVNAGQGFVRQFVATPLGEGLTVEEQAGGGKRGGIRLEIFDAKPGLFPDQVPLTGDSPERKPMGVPPLGLGAGGRIGQKIHADPYGIEVWDLTRSASVVVKFLDPSTFASLTGREPPPNPIDAATYARLGLPWFELYEQDVVDVAPAEAFRDLKTLNLNGREGVDLPPLYVRRVGDDRK